MMKIDIEKASVKVRFRKLLGGSVLKGTVFNKWQGVDTHLIVESKAPKDKIAHLIRNAKNGCFAEGLIVQSVPLTSTIELNGEKLDLEGITD
tara:strand:+ start:10436 stop:10711 length:276 start_codon:yes stop_codon:yes gene_type:complete